MNGETQTQSKKAEVTLERVTPETLITYALRLAAILTAHVEAGQSTNFIHPYKAADAVELFTRNAPSLALAPGPGGVVMWLAHLPPSEEPLESIDKDGNSTDHIDIVGSVQLAFHVAPNGGFRSEVRKLIVDVRYERRGIGRKLMNELETEARDNGSKLCLLDTEQGYGAEKSYTSMGWTTIGVIPNYASTPDQTAKRAAVLMYKEL